MTDSSPPAEGRTDTALRVVRAAPAAVFRAFLDPNAFVRWLPPKGMTARVTAFDPRPGGALSLVLTHGDPSQAAAGKSGGASDVVQGRFIEILPDRRIVQTFAFDSDRPEFAGTLRMTWTFTPVPGGTEVQILCQNVPPGISREDHLAGFRSTLENLAGFVE